MNYTIHSNSYNYRNYLLHTQTIHFIGQTGPIVITIPNRIIREYNLEKPTHLILERQSEGIFLRKLPLDYQNQKPRSEQQNLSAEIDKEVINFEYLWHQGPSALKEAQKSAKKIFMLLKMKYGILFSTKEIVKKMMERLGHLNKISDSEIKNLIGDDLIEEKRNK